MNQLRPYSKEIGVGVLILLGLYAYWNIWIADIQEKIDKLASNDGITGKTRLRDNVRKMLGDAKQVSKYVEEIRRAPIGNQRLETVIERYNNEHNLRLPRARLSPKPPLNPEGRLQEEQVEVAVNDLSNSELIQYLTGMETLAVSIRIRRVQIQRVGDLASLVLHISAIKVL